MPHSQLTALQGFDNYPGLVVTMSWTVQTEDISVITESSIGQSRIIIYKSHLGQQLPCPQLCLQKANSIILQVAGGGSVDGGKLGARKEPQGSSFLRLSTTKDSHQNVFPRETTAEYRSLTAHSTGSHRAQTQPQTLSQPNVQGSQNDITPDL